MDHAKWFTDCRRLVANSREFMEPQTSGSCWCVARRTLVIFALVAVVVYLTGGMETSVVAAR